MKHNLILRIAIVASCIALSLSAAAQQTRGIGVYPGNPREYFGPTLKQDTAYRNLALHRAVYQSGAHDYNLTCQLLTDGVVSTEAPAFLDVLANGKPLPANERELTINDSEWSRIPITGAEATLEYRWSNMTVEADEVVVEGFVAYDHEEDFRFFSIQCQTTLGEKMLSFTHGCDSLPGTPRRKRVVNDPNKQDLQATALAREIRQVIKLRRGHTFETAKLTFRMNNALYWSIKEVTFMRRGKAVRTLFPAQRFTSVWKASKGDWAYVDLGAEADIHGVCLHWQGKAPEHTLQVSSDASKWSEYHNTPTRGRYVRITLAEAACLSELEVMGRGGVKAVPQAEVGWNNWRYLLSGGNWTVCPIDCPIPGKAKAVGSEIVATVPATVLSSYRNAGALPDPNFDDNLAMLSESFFNRDFLYKKTFRVPSELQGKRVLLNFDGINWKARVVLNGTELGRVEGAFMRGVFDITKHLKDENTLLVYIEKNANPASRKIKTALNTSFNGGVLGADNPTFHATIGWDWISTIPGRDLGIWNDVYLTAAYDVTISDPLVTTKLERGLATMTPSVFVRNYLDREVKGILRGFIGDIAFEKAIALAPMAETEVFFSPDEFPQLKEQQMRLWWPNGYGEPTLYRAGYNFKAEGAEDGITLSYKAGIREMTYSEEMSRLQIYINGQRFIPLGGNWGFSENHLNYRGREYDIAVDYHRQMNCTMIRNWVGMTGDEEFYEACDRHGIMVWQDFWLANPVDGPNPANEPMFMANAEDYVRRIRRHPSIALYCGRNEGYPPASLNGQLDSLVERLSPGHLYIPSSADDGVSGHGPYRAMPVKHYFENQTGKLHSERGMPNVPNIESLRRMLAKDHLWPQNEFWGKHDFTQRGAQYGLSFNALVEGRLGTPASAEQFAEWAQWQNYDGYRAMYEASNLDRQGLIIWMSHSCWPSMVWQTYDYYFDPTAAFFGIKKACEPLHVQYNEATGMVQMVNLMRPTADVHVRATIYNLQGRAIWQSHRDMVVPTDTTMNCFPVNVAYAKGESTLLRLEATSNLNNTPISTNTYMLWGETSKAELAQVPQTSLTISPAGNSQLCKEWVVTNTGTSPALMVRLCLIGADCKQILPVDYSDNYFHLLPGERRTISIRWNKADDRGQQPVLKVSAFNVPAFAENIY